MRALVSLLAFAAALLAPPALAQDRYALLIGNSDYNGDGVVDVSEAGVAQSGADGFLPDLRNPANDVAAVGAVLRRAGYEVQLLQNATLAQMTEGVAWLARSARAAGPDGVVVFYFAGHGVNVNMRDYFVPAGARVPDLPPPTIPEGASSDPSTAWLQGRLGLPDAGRERALRASFLAAQDLTSAMPDPALGLPQPGVARLAQRVFIFDSCRNNAFFENNGFEDFMARRSTVGLIGFTPSPVYVFSATPPQVAEDGAGRLSPFAAAMTRHLGRPLQTVVQMFDAVQREVLAATDNRQRPDALANNDVQKICLVSCPR